jgi:murein DD-endopeptidase MepM/ murein hydrolase activator NlpD
MSPKRLNRISFLGVLIGTLLASCGGNAGYKSGDPTTSYWYKVTNGKAMPRRKPGAHVVEVRHGDTLYSIARANSVDVQALIDANNLYEPYILSPGQTLNIPQLRSHVVVKEDTIFSISKSYNVDMASLALMNSIEPPYTISLGQRLLLPGTEAGTVDWVSKLGDIGFGSEEVEENYGTADVAPYVKAGAGGRFLRPVSGRLISSFGPKKGGLRNDGINISASSGAPIFAAEEGEVIYTGNELRGYGNLILIRHSGNWVTAYSHIHRFRVARGDRIRRGQHIADVGQSGNVNSPQLHFELRDGSNPVNPVLHLSAE